MKKLVIILLGMFCVFSFAERNGCSDKKAKRVLVIPGGGLDVGVPLGIYKGLKEKGWEPDMVITSCGGNLLATAIQVNSDPADLEKFFMHKDFHDFYKQVEITDHWNGWNLLKRKRELEDPNIPDVHPSVFENTMMNIPASFELDGLDQGFKSGKVRTIVLSTKMSFDESHVGQPRNGKPIYTQVINTDTETAKLFEGGFDAPMGQAAGSVLHPKAEVRTDLPIGVASRAGISEPGMIKPIKIGNHYYAAGGADLYPIEIAKKVVDPECGEIIMIHPPKLTDRQQAVLRRGFRFDFGARYDEVFKSKGVTFIDTRQIDKDLKGNLMWPEPKLGLGVPQLVINIPNDNDDTSDKDLVKFHDILKTQIEYGRKRAIETLDKRDADRKAVPHAIQATMH